MNNIVLIDLTDSHILDQCVRFVEHIYHEVYTPLGIFDKAIYPKHIFDVTMFEPELSMNISKIYVMYDSNNNIIALLECVKCSILTSDYMSELISKLDSEIDVEQTIFDLRSKMSDGTSGYIKKIYIKNEYRSKGLATRLLNHVFNNNSYKKLYYDVYAKNTSMCDVSSKFGSNEIGKIWQKYTDSCVFYELDRDVFNRYLSNK